MTSAAETAANRERFRGMFSIIRPDVREELGVVIVSLFKHRANRAIDQARDKGFSLCWTAFALDKSTDGLPAERKFS